MEEDPIDAQIVSLRARADAAHVASIVHAYLQIRWPALLR